MRKSKLMGVSDTARITVDSNKIGSPGVRGVFTVIPNWKDESRNAGDRHLDTTLRKFSVSMLLAKHPPITEVIRGDFTAADGASFCRMENGAAVIFIDCPAGRFRIDKNEADEFSMVSMEVNAHDSDESTNAFLKAVGPALDHFSYIGDVPIHTSTLKTVDTRHEIQHISYTAPYRPLIVKNQYGAIDVSLLPVYSMYREAKNSSSAFYQLLCYHKIIEGLFRIRSSLLRQTKRNNVHLTPITDIFPSHDDLALPLAPYVGKSIKYFYDDLLTPRFRDSVAHFMLKGSSILDVGLPEMSSMFADVAFASELCVRVLIENQENLILQSSAVKASGPV